MGFCKGFDIWTFHGEIPCGIDDMPESLKEQVPLKGDWVNNNQILYDIFVASQQEENFDELENIEVIPEYEDIKNFTKIIGG